MKQPSLLVLGGAGFIGSNFVRRYAEKYPERNIVVYDKLTYAGNWDNLQGVRCIKLLGDICDKRMLAHTVRAVNATEIVNFAAESHVDNSIADSAPFVTTNVLGMQVILEVIREYSAQITRFVHISTDEVYGSLPLISTQEDGFTETTPLNPSSPYAASKAAGDLLIRSYIHTFGIPAIIVRSSNVYGPRQHVEKFIPKTIVNIIADTPTPIYGRGLNIRDWLYVDDACDAILTVLQNGRNHEIYNIGGGDERVTNYRLGMEILRWLNKPITLLQYVPDRLGHDERYSMNYSKIRNELNWCPLHTFEMGLFTTIRWYKDDRFY